MSIIENKQDKERIQIFNIFTEVQQLGKDFNSQLDLLIKLVEDLKKEKSKQIISYFEEIFKIIILNRVKGMDAFSHVCDFLKNFLSKLLKLKNDYFPKYFLNYFIQFLSREPKNKSQKITSMTLLLIFSSFSESHFNYFNEKSFNSLKDICIGGLYSVFFMELSLKIIKKVPFLQKNEQIMARLHEIIMSNASTKIKREIFNILDMTDKSNIKYLISLHTDESSDLRYFIYEKLVRVERITDIFDNSIDKASLILNSLLEKSQKNRQSGFNLFKKFLFEIGILGNDNENEINKMDVDDENNIHEGQNGNIILNKSPSRIFDHFEVKTIMKSSYLSQVFSIIVESILENLDIKKIKNIIVDLISKIFNNHKQNNNYITEESLIVFEDKKNEIKLENDILFLQLIITYSQEKKGKSDEIELILKENYFSTDDYSDSIQYYHKHNRNCFMLFQLLLIGLNGYVLFCKGSFKSINDVLRILLLDIRLGEIQMNDENNADDYSNTSLSVKNNINDREISLPNIDYIRKSNENQSLNIKPIDAYIENSLLPKNRKIIFSADDLIEEILSLMYLTSSDRSNQISFFNSICFIIGDLTDDIYQDIDNPNDISVIQSRKNDLKDLIMNQTVEIGQLEQLQVEKKGNKKRFENQIKEELLKKEKLVCELDKLVEEEKLIYIRTLKICEFLFKTCRIKPDDFKSLLQMYIFPGIKKTELPEVTKYSLLALGSLVINHFQAYQNLTKLFFDQINKKDYHSVALKEIEIFSLIIILDTLTIENIPIPYWKMLFKINDEKEEFVQIEITNNINKILLKYLYSPETIHQLITISFLCRIIYLERNIIKSKEYIIRLLSIVNFIFHKQNRTESYEDLVFKSKVYEIISSFMFMYSYKNQSTYDLLINSILFILSNEVFKQGVLSSYSSSIENKSTLIYSLFSFKFLSINSLLIQVINNNVTQLQVNEEQVKRRRLLQKKVLFRILKKLVFMFDVFIGVDRKSPSKVKNKKSDEKIIKTREFFNFMQKDNLEKNIKLIFHSSKFDNTVISEFFGEDHVFSIKLFTILHYFNNKYGLFRLSDCCHSFYNDTLKKNDFKVEISSLKIDLLESTRSLEGYLQEKKNAYMKCIIDEFDFLFKSKDEKIKNEIEIYESDENEENEEERVEESKDKNDNNIKINEDQQKVESPNESKIYIEDNDNNKNRNKRNSISNRNKNVNNNRNNISVKNSKVLTDDEDEDEDDKDSDIENSSLSKIKEKYSLRTRMQRNYNEKTLSLSINKKDTNKSIIRNTISNKIQKKKPNLFSKTIEDSDSSNSSISSSSDEDDEEREGNIVKKNKVSINEKLLKNTKANQKKNFFKKKK